MKIDKNLILQRNYESLALAKLDAAQFVNNSEAFADSLPKPAQWKVRVTIVRVKVIPAASATEPVVMHIEAIAIGEEKDIDRWEQEYRSLHNNRGLSRRQEAEEFQRMLKNVQGTKPQ